MQRQTAIIAILIFIALCASSGCGGGGGGGGGSGATPAESVTPAKQVTLGGVVVRNETAAKDRRMKFTDVGIGGSPITGNPASGYLVVLTNGATELARSEIAADGSYSLSYRSESVTESDRLTVRIVNIVGQTFTLLRLMPLSLEGGRQYRMNLEWRPNTPDVHDPLMQAMAVYLTLPNEVNIVADNAIDSDGDGVADTVGARADFADNGIQFDRDMNGIFGEPGDVVLSGVASFIFDGNLADGYQNNPADRRLAVNDIQATIGNILLQYRPSTVVGDGAGELNATLEAVVTPAGRDSLYGAKVRFVANVGTFGGGNPVVVTIDPADPRIRMNGNGVAKINLIQTLPAGTTGAARATATADMNGLANPVSATLTINPSQDGQGLSPRVLSVSPASGSIHGNDAVIVQGGHFRSGAVVLFGDRPASDVAVVNDTTVTCVTPFGMAGAATVTVLNPDGRGHALIAGYRYVPPAVLVAETENVTDVFEGGKTDSYSIVLATRPLATVTIRITADGQTSVSPSALSFTASNWNIAQSVTVAATDDNDVKGSHLSTIIHAIASVDPFYRRVDVAGVTARVTDNDSAGIAVTETGGSTDIAEGGGADAYYVALTSRPTADVVVTITADGQCLTDRSRLTFTPVDWNTSQVVMVSAVDNAAIDGAHTGTIAHAVISADAMYNGIAVTNIVVRIADNDRPGVTVLESGGATRVAEGGVTDIYSIALTSRPIADVVISIVPDGQVSTNTTALIFTPGNWSASRMVTVTAVDDAVAEGTHTAIIRHVATSADGNFNGVLVRSITVSIADNDAAGVAVTPSGGSTDVVEGQGADTYAIVLTSQPTANVIVTIAGDAQCSASPASVIFTPANWNVAQAVTVAAVNDAIAEGAHAGTVTHAVSSADATYGGIAVTNIVVHILDDDVAGVSVTQSGGATAVAEGGATDTYAVVLTSQPIADVTVSIASNAQCAADISAMTFTTANWNTPRTVTVSAVDDAMAEGPHAGAVAHAVASADARYHGIVVAGIVVNIADNDTPGVSIAQTGGSTDVAEGGATDSYSIVLDSQPTDDVSVTITPNAGCSADMASVMFTPANWNVAQIVTIAAVDNFVIDGARVGTIAHGVASVDANYAGLAVASVAVNISDNDIAGIVIVATGGSTDLIEGGATDGYTMVLTSQPAADVVVTVDPGAQCSVDAPIVTFTAANWNVPRTVTVTAVNDAVAEGPHGAAIAHAVASADANYHGLAVANVVVNITDDDTPAVAITRSGGSTDVAEGGAGDSYTLVLTSQPTADVVVTIGPGVQCSVDTPTVTFTAANWNAPRTVTVAAVNDAVAEGTHGATIAHAVASADGSYDAIAVASVIVGITDNDIPGVTITPAGGTIDLVEGGATDTYTIVLTSQPTADVTIAISGGTQCSTNPGSVTFTSADWSSPRTVTVTAVNDYVAEGLHSGTLTHGVTSSDGNYHAMSIPNVPAQITDNDIAGVTITQSGGSTDVFESVIGIDTYTLVLRSQPTSNVVVTITRDAQCTVSPTSVTFTTTNWFMPRTITVTAVNEAVAEGAHTGTIAHSAASADVTYNGIAIGNVTANITEIYTAKIIGSVTGDVQGGVTLTLSQFNATTVSAADGSYVFGGLPNLTYTVTPRKANYSFSPASIKNIGINNADVTLQAFVASSSIPNVLAYRVVDAEYSDSMNKMIMVSSGPDQLHVYDPEAQTETTVALTLAPKCVSVSPDGTKAAVGHIGKVTYVDLTTSSVINTFTTTATVGDIVLAGNGYIYAFPTTDYRIHCINTVTGSETLHTGNMISRNIPAKLHPSGEFIYGINIGSPDDLEKYDVRGGTAAFLRDSPYHGLYTYSANLWIGKDGRRIVVKSGNVFKTSSDSAIDMTYGGSIGSLLGLCQDNARGILGIIDATYDREVYWHRYADLTNQGSCSLGGYTNGSTGYDTHGKFIFCNESLGVVYTIAQIDATAGLVNDYAILRNRLPRFAHAGANQVVLPGDTVTLDGTGSNGLGGVSLTYAWTQLSGPAVVLSNSAIAQPTFTAPAGGSDIVFQLTVNDGTATATATVTVSVRTDGPMRPLAYQITDAEYSASLNRIVMVSCDPSLLHIYNPETNTEVSVPLLWTPRCVSVSPDGTKAAVGHDLKVTYIDLATASVINTFNTSVIVWDIVLAGNGFIYLSSSIPSKTHIEIVSGVETPYPSAYPLKRAKLHPSGSYLYWVDEYSAEKFDIRGGVPVYISAFSYSDNHPYSGIFWIGKDGMRIFARSRHVFKSSTDFALDITYSGSLSQTTTVKEMGHDGSRGIIAVIDETQGQKLQWYRYSDLTFEGDTVLTKHSRATTEFNSHGKFVFCNESLGVVYTIAQVDTTAGLANDYAILRNRLPRFAHAGPNQVVLPGDTVTLDGTGSNGLGGASLTYAWTQLSGSAVVLSNSAIAQPTFTAPAGGGDIVFQLTVNDGVATAAATVTISVRTDGPMRPLAYQITDAEYSASLNRIVMVSADPSLLHIYNPETNTETSIPLAWTPRCVSVSPDGTKAAVGHDLKVTYVDLATASVIATFDTTAYVSDIVMAGNGYIYAFPRVSPYQQIRCINTASGQETLHTGLPIYAGTRVKLHPSGDYIYGANNGLYPSGIEQYDIRGGTATYVARHGQYAINGNLWIGKDGKRIFVRGSNVFKPEPYPEIDMKYTGSLSQTSMIRWLDNDPITGIFAVINETLDQKIQWYHYADLSYEGERLLTRYSAGTTNYNSHGRFIFCNESLGVVYTLVQVDPTAGLINDHAVIRDMLPTYAYAGPNQIVLTNDNPVTLNGSQSRGPGALSYSWIQTSGPAVTLNNAAIASPSFAAPAGTYDLVFNLTVSDAGTFSASDTVTVSVRIDGNLRLFDFPVIDSEYSNSLAKIVMISDDPPKIHIYDPETKVLTALNLSWVPSCLSVSPDGTRAAVGHNGKITYVDLTTPSIIRSFNTSANVSDIVLAGNGYFYASTVSPGWDRIRSINIATEAETLHTGNFVYYRTRMKLHPSGDYIYGANSSDIEKYDVRSGTAAYVADSPYHGEYAFSGNLWISKDGQQIIARSGNIFKSSTNAAIDMTYNGTLAQATAVKDLAHDNSRGVIALIDESNDQQLRWYRFADMTYRGAQSLTSYSDSTANYLAHGKYVYCNESLGAVYTIAQVNATGGLLNGYFAVTRNQYPVIANAGAAQSVLTNSVVTLNGTGSMSMGGTPLTYSWIQLSGPAVALDDPSLARPSFTAPVVDGDLTFRLTATDGTLTHTATVTVFVRSDGPLRFFASQVTDAEYSNSLNKIVTVSDNPPQLNVFDLVTRAVTSLDLAWAPKCVSVSPDGTKVAVGHNAKISYVDLSTLSIIGTFDTATVAWDIVLAGNGYVYVFSDKDEKIHCVEIATGVSSLNTGNSINKQTPAKLHPGGEYLYTAFGPPSYYLKRYDIRGGVADTGPYYDLTSKQNVWIGEDGLYVFSRSGGIFNLSTMTYVGALSQSGIVREMDHAPGKDLVGVISESGDTGVQWYQYSTLTYQGSTTLPQYNAFPSHGKFVFFRSDGTKCYVLLQVDAAAGLTFDNAVTEITIP